MRSSPHSLSSSKCEERKQYHEKMQFVHSINLDIYRLGSYAVEFLKRRRRGWSSREQGGLRATPMDPVQIQEFDKKKGVE
jgi:hypothetical protein